MNQLNISTKPLLIGGAMLALFILNSETFAANIKRSCDAEYFINHIDTVSFISNGNKKKVSFPLGTLDNMFISEYKLQGQGRCGKLVPNRCRERARDRLISCAKAHVKALHKKPQECSTSSITRYPIDDLEPIIKERVCKGIISTDNGKWPGIKISDLFSRPYTLEGVVIGIHIDGNDKCGKKSGRVTIEGGKNYPYSGNDLYVLMPLKRLNITCK